MVTSKWPLTAVFILMLNNQMTLQIFTALMLTLQFNMLATKVPTFSIRIQILMLFQFSYFKK